MRRGKFTTVKRPFFYTFTLTAWVAIETWILTPKTCLTCYTFTLTAWVAIETFKEGWKSFLFCIPLHLLSEWQLRRGIESLTNPKFKYLYIYCLSGNWDKGVDAIFYFLSSIPLHLLSEWQLRPIGPDNVSSVKEYLYIYCLSGNWNHTAVVQLFSSILQLPDYTIHRPTQKFRISDFGIILKAEFLSYF